jgi:predicted transcriptional regulator
VGTSPISTNVTYTDGYTVGTSPLPGSIIDSSGADGTWSFWQVPLWMQIASISSAFVGLLVLLKLLPVAFGKIQNILGNRNREKIYGYIQTHPGTTTRDISRKEGMNLGTVKYHINMLTAANKITTKRIKKFVRIFQNSSTYDEREKTIISALAVPACKSIIFYLLDNPGATNRQISKILGISDSGSYQHVKRLVNDRIIWFEKDGGQKKYYVNDEAKEFIKKSPVLRPDEKN